MENNINVFPLFAKAGDDAILDGGITLYDLYAGIIAHAALMRATSGDFAEYRHKTPALIAQIAHHTAIELLRLRPVDPKNLNPIGSIERANQGLPTDEQQHPQGGDCPGTVQASS